MKKSLVIGVALCLALGVGLCVVLLLGGCTSAASAPAPGKPAPTATAPAKPAVKPVEKMTPTEILAAFTAAGSQIGKVTVWTEATDENKLMGRPHQYVAKFNWDDKAIKELSAGSYSAGSIETFANVEDAQARKTYIDGIIKSAPMFTEYDTLNGSVLMRLDGSLTPTQAKAYAAVFQKLGH
jgi:hypothetical protein